ncbi:glycerol-3-phosphate 1-O-acyltransferase PlsY [Pampinifervens florentissimum]|uniref:glycerol-3-phosphate 1-O-acyltransferase PlsY n=1 Tax=Pampinifervens florentissimum TaxID=1632019 RepID=UPI0013B47AD9|nr:glycerol-3-phosphate 1-O-acyltransferase PlsY [Hydrogenobacter sp. T-8]QID33267.1 glycerol-3-phosphate 1-O-acyltransferase PlsY [Hydrogenobacter sp. T-8]
MDSMLLVIFAYLYGSVLFGEHIARSKGVDIRSVGSGNVGATNVGRALGKRYAVLVFLLDFSKGLIPMLLARLYFGFESWTAFFVGLASLLGHMYPVFHNFKGGKGVATAFGTLTALSPLIAVLSIAFWGLIFRWKGIVSVASLSASALAVLLLLISGYPLKIFLMALLMFFFILYRHKENIARLMEGKEHSFRS